MSAPKVESAIDYGKERDRHRPRKREAGTEGEGVRIEEEKKMGRIKKNGQNGIKTSYNLSEVRL